MHAIMIAFCLLSVDAKEFDSADDQMQASFWSARDK